MDIALFLAVSVLSVVLAGGTVAWFLFVRSQDAERRERERRIAEQANTEQAATLEQAVTPSHE